MFREDVLVECGRSFHCRRRDPERSTPLGDATDEVWPPGVNRRRQRRAFPQGAGGAAVCRAAIPAGRGARR